MRWLTEQTTLPQRYDSDGFPKEVLQEHICSFDAVTKEQLEEHLGMSRNSSFQLTDAVRPSNEMM